MIRALILFGFLGLFASSAWGECIPVVFAFRHAEDTSAFALTPTGRAHAELYKRMVTDFEATVLEPPDKMPCRVTKVYSVPIEDKEGTCGNSCKNATNSFYTARPLANDRMGTDPITKVAGLQLSEFVGNGNTAPALAPSVYLTDMAEALRTALLATANLGQSSAIFWTSEGLQVLGGVIIKRDSAVPKKNGWTLPPRNAVYLFKAKAGAPIAEFDDTPKAAVTLTHPVSVSSTFYLQCFNWVGPTDQPRIGGETAERDANYFVKPDKPDGSTQLYYCGWNVQSAVGGKPPDGCNVTDPAADCGLIPFNRTKDIKGKICDTTSLLPDSHGANIFGACRGPA